MAEETRLKSAYELAMERLRSKEGAGAERPLSEEQKAEIAQVRAEFAAKRAEADVLQASAMAKASAAQNLETIDNLVRDHERELRRLAEAEEERVARIKSR